MHTSSCSHVVWSPTVNPRLLLPSSLASVYHTMTHAVHLVEHLSPTMLPRLKQLTVALYWARNFNACSLWSQLSNWQNGYIEAQEVHVVVKVGVLRSYISPTACCSNSDLAIDAWLARIWLIEYAGGKQHIVNFVPPHLMKAYGGRGIAPLILNLGCK